MSTHTGGKRFNCEICGAKFCRSIHLQRHMSTHTREKPFQCEICGAKFSQNFTLKGHTCQQTLERKLFIVKSVELNFAGVHISTDTC